VYFSRLRNAAKSQIAPTGILFHSVTLTYQSFDPLFQGSDIFSLLSIWDGRLAIVYVSLSSLSDSTCGYRADLNFLSTPSSSSRSTNFIAITSVLPTSLPVTLEGFRAFGMFFSRNYLPHIKCGITPRQPS